ncbi:MAG: DinB family protein [Colwellia sp.]|nr:DinB family protein [Colwellia sp.]MCW8865531.1 DinB family protein [Colwellia sp.]MCW9080164.1 DinB family protein [Colwellia sp.]
MSLVSNFQMMAEYNHRINEQLITCCQSLPTSDLVKETHSFFPSVISYWNHILFGDMILLQRLAANNISSLSLADFSNLPTPKSPSDIYHQDFDAIVVLRRKVDSLITQYCHDLSEADCEHYISYQTTEGENITKKVADVTQHLFNHQTHHRGQLTCILSQLGVDYGCMDLPVIVSEGSCK